MGKRATLKNNSTVRRYSNALKLQALSDLSSGKRTKSEVISHYGVNPSTLYGWIKKFGRLDLYNPRLIVQMPQEPDKIKLLKAEIQELKEALVQSQLKQLKAECDLEVALEMMGTNKDHFTKKHEASHSTKRSKEGKR